MPALETQIKKTERKARVCSTCEIIEQATLLQKLSLIPAQAELFAQYVGAEDMRRVIDCPPESLPAICHKLLYNIFLKSFFSFQAAEKNLPREHFYIGSAIGNAIFKSFKHLYKKFVVESKCKMCSVFFEYPT
jgi:hypothetical protein